MRGGATGVPWWYGNQAGVSIVVEGPVSGNVLLRREQYRVMDDPELNTQKELLRLLAEIEKTLSTDNSQ